MSVVNIEVHIYRNKIIDCHERMLYLDIPPPYTYNIPLVKNATALQKIQMASSVDKFGCTKG